MKDVLDKLTSVAGGQLGAQGVSHNVDVARELRGLLNRKNGFYAFEAALHVYPVGSVSPGTVSLELWNDIDLWRQNYGELAEGLIFFAEDVFGGQFALRSGEVVSFDPETGDSEVLASDIEGWAELVLADHAVLTGFPLADAWQKLNGPIPSGHRLLPKKPFVLGGQFSADNLYSLDAATGMRLRADLAIQLRDLPDGAAVSFKIVE